MSTLPPTSVNWYDLSPRWISLQNSDHWHGKRDEFWECSWQGCFVLFGSICERFTANKSNIHRQTRKSFLGGVCGGSYPSPSSLALFRPFFRANLDLIRRKTFVLNPSIVSVVMRYWFFRATTAQELLSNYDQLGSQVSSGPYLTCKASSVEPETYESASNRLFASTRGENSWKAGQELIDSYSQFESSVSSAKSALLQTVPLDGEDVSESFDKLWNQNDVSKTNIPL